uniref:UDP-N-acetylglucosamine--dolichyl-phosphate N-acetylglucosaminephosphotransferase n=1 Tax=Syphacia muris TaxID=451379 RepID=A0A0N5AYT7_9BILA
MVGHDLCKPPSTNPVPEPVGVISAGVYLIVMLTILPFILYEWTGSQLLFPREKLLSFLSALLGICSAVLLGFADDVFDLRWRHKLILPTLSALPILLVYHATGSSTTVYIPNQLQFFLPFGKSVDIGILYYVYMAMMVIFCTNAINILAGVNGLEVGQAVVIAASAIVFNTVQLIRLEEETWCHLMTLYFLIPFLTIAFVLLHFNWYPARVFVGDTFCYWAGMTLGSVCILGHFSKTMALFFIPQIFNFLYSLPQLFHFLPCPRHRLPKYDSKTDTVGMSFAEFDLTRKALTYCEVIVEKKYFFSFNYIIYSLCYRWTRMNNLTLINLVLKIFGSMHERSLVIVLLFIQIICSAFAFFVRFYVANIFYDVVR